MEKPPTLLMADGKTPLERAKPTVPRELMMLNGEGSFYDGASSSPELSGWNPMSVSADAAMFGGRDVVTGRARDLFRNNGTARNAVLSELGSVIGATIKLSYQPNLEAMGIDASSEDAAKFIKSVETQFKAYAEDPLFRNDKERELTFAGQLGLAYIHSFIEGDALAIVHWNEKPTGKWHTQLQVMHPDQLSNPNDAPDTDSIRGGVQKDEDGAPIGYHFRKAHPMDIPGGSAVDAYTWETVPRFHSWGRPRTIHFYQKHSAGQTRGISRFASIIEAMTMEHKHRKVEIQASVLSAMLGLFIKSPFDHELVEGALQPSDTDIGSYQEMRGAYHDEAGLTFNGVTIPKLFPNEDLSTVASPHPHSSFDQFQRVMLRHIAAGLGTSYEVLSRDFSQTNYSSARAALMEVWREILQKRSEFCSRFVNVFFVAWLEEAIDAGHVELPAGWPEFDYVETLSHYVQCSWIGPARGWIDPQKEAGASKTRMGSGLSTLQQECAEQGLDYEQVLRQQKLEQTMREELGLPSVAELAAGPKK